MGATELVELKDKIRRLLETTDDLTWEAEEGHWDLKIRLGATGTATVSGQIRSDLQHKVSMGFYFQMEQGLLRKALQDIETIVTSYPGITAD